MKTKHFPGPVLALLSLLAIVGLARVWSQSANSSLQSASMKPASSALPAPPVAPVRPVTDDYYGTKIVDPYRYMENLKDPEVQSWMKAQDDYTRAALAGIPGREKLLSRIRKLDQTVPQVLPLRLPGNLYLIQKRLPTENVSKLYLRHGMSGEDKLLVNPEQIKLAAAANQKKGTNAIMGTLPSNNDQYVGVGIAPGGSERDTEIHVFETASGKETGDVIFRAEGGIEGWLPDDRSFVYARLQTLPAGAPVTEVEQKVRTYLHVLGTDSAKDPAVFGYGAVPTIHVDPTYFASVETPPDSDYAIGGINSGVSPNSAFYIEPDEDIGKTNAAWRKVADFSDEVSDVEVHGDDLYVLTFKNALRYKVLRTSALHPDLATAEVIVPPSQAVVTSISTAEDALYVRLRDGGIGRLLRVPYGPKPQAQEVALPFKGTIGVETDPRLRGALVFMTSWTKAFTIYSYDPRTNSLTDTKLQPAGPYDAPTNIESVEVKVRSYDGTMVPLSIVYPKDTKRDGSNPTLLDGYGSYGTSSAPFFVQYFQAWYEQGGIYAECHVRGGGEYGEEWHLAGKGPTKPNTWRDFIACAQYLIENKYTSPARLAGSGTSAGGILIGRAITSRPDLFAAAIDWVGVSDMLRFETTANGVPNIPEFGSVKTKAGFDALYAMSAYAHIKAGTKYPAVLLMTGANDPRVDPWQMDKMAARLQAATSSGKPVLLRVNYAGGHQIIGGTEAQTQRVFADQWSFLLWQFGMPGFQQQKP
ncbi:MAG TPA: prolyl oligopeptidase family serine peptidase [Candidatus Acidoferrales bacterium]|nr:prolyl oligopeptidase family serine peptidase [Candidatus Acidoferrales bacterium]